MTDTRSAAQNWARTWKKAWNKRDMEALLSLYAPNVAYWSEPYRDPFAGIDRLREYFAQAFKVEHSNRLLVRRTSGGWRSGGGGVVGDAGRGGTAHHSGRDFAPAFRR
jgi:ketosteroid isomerase-like protein